MSLDLSTLDLKDKILVVNTSKDQERNVAEQLGEAYDSLQEAGCIFSMILTPDVTIETLDENDMRNHGWVRVAASE